MSAHRDRDAAALQALPLTGPDDARAWMAAYRDFMRAHRTYGSDELKPASWRPMGVAYPWLFDRAARAEVMAGEAYWQIPYEQAVRRHPTLTRARWEHGRVINGAR